ncbi:sensor histidine kinase [Pseudoxanthomonas japonensis]|nr:HAMP domain-containing sensor histidine kinase [Pseudoxanthomonas japonensis]
MALESTIDTRTLYNFIHQVVNPLNGVIGTIDNMIDGSLKGDKDQRLKAVRAQLEHSVELIRNMAYLSRLSIPSELERLKSVPQRCVVPELIIQAAQFFQESDSHIDVELDDPETQYIVFGSKDLLRQVFMNLFDNAAKYSDQQSKVLVSTRVQRLTKNLIVEVSNTGVGFHNSDKEKIFDLGVRGGEAEAHTGEGSGIGLYICRQVLEQVFGATIEAEHSGAGRTTTVRLRFPRFKNEGQRSTRR